MSEKSEINRISEKFDSLKKEWVTPEKVLAVLEERIVKDDLLRIAHLEGSVLVFDWNENLQNETFASEDDAKAALAFYNESMQNNPNIICRNILLKDALKVSIRYELISKYRETVEKLKEEQERLPK